MIMSFFLILTKLITAFILSYYLMVYTLKYICVLNFIIGKSQFGIIKNNCINHCPVIYSLYVKESLMLVACIINVNLSDSIKIYCIKVVNLLMPTNHLDFIRHIIH
jgi:hypothetical protein